ARKNAKYPRIPPLMTSNTLTMPASQAVYFQNSVRRATLGMSFVCRLSRSGHNGAPQEFANVGVITNCEGACRHGDDASHPGVSGKQAVKLSARSLSLEVSLTAGSA